MRLSTGLPLESSDHLHVYFGSLQSRATVPSPHMCATQQGYEWIKWQTLWRRLLWCILISKDPIPSLCKVLWQVPSSSASSFHPYLISALVSCNTADVTRYQGPSDLEEHTIIILLFVLEVGSLEWIHWAQDFPTHIFPSLSSLPWHWVHLESFGCCLLPPWLASLLYLPSSSSLTMYHILSDSGNYNVDFFGGGRMFPGLKILFFLSHITP